ncbi:8-amino-7-oxononanoate synthase [Methylocystis sp.]|uniref:8-amino-7-oxononanoate synthase n=1 Tax=Methylocystis sp. TaxID=1911079 RepID=UPI003D147341
MLDRYAQDLAGLSGRGRSRMLAPRVGLDFASNDYLALAESPELAAAASAAVARGVPVGAGGSRLLRGNHPEHEALEEEAARFFGAESVLYFSAGFTANEALLSTAPQREDLILYDALAHASAHEGMRLARAPNARFSHNDVGAAEDAIRAWRNKGERGRPWIVVESLYSMDGDKAPLDELYALATLNDAFLVIDEAHATGVYGPGGRGLAARLEGKDNVITLHTCGKAMGVAGGLLGLPRILRDFMINRCRPFIFATAPSPLIAACVRAALKIIEAADERRGELMARVDFAGAELRRLCAIEPSGSQIQPIIVGSDIRATTLASRLQAQGYDIRAIRPPTVPEGSARLRIALTLNTRKEDIARMVAHLGEELARLET